MNKVLKIIKREFLTRVTSKGFIIGTVLGPFILAAMTLLPAFISSYSEPETQIIQVLDRSELFSNNLTTLFNDTLSNGSPRFIMMPGDTAACRTDPAPFHAALEI